MFKWAHKIGKNFHKQAIGYIKNAIKKCALIITRARFLLLFDYIQKGYATIVQIDG